MMWGALIDYFKLLLRNKKVVSSSHVRIRTLIYIILRERLTELFLLEMAIVWKHQKGELPIPGNTRGYLSVYLGCGRGSLL